MDIHVPSHPVKEAGSLFSEGTTNVTSGMSFAFFNTAGYDLQDLYTRMQDDAEKNVVTAAMIGTSMVGKPTPVEVEDVKRQLRVALGGLVIVENIAKKLDELYDKALKDTRD